MSNTHSLHYGKLPAFRYFYCSRKPRLPRNNKVNLPWAVHIRVAKCTWGASKALLSLTHNYLTKLESRAEAHIAVAIDVLAAEVAEVEVRVPRAARDVLRRRPVVVREAMI